MNTKILDPIGVTKGQSNNKFQLYHIIGKDESNSEYVITFGVEPNFVESTDKAISRFHPIDIIVEDENESAED